MAERYLVIGSNSFSGAHYAANLVANGNEVYGISRSKKPEILFCPEKWHHNRSLDYPFFQLDLNKDFEQIKRLISEVQPSIVVNFSAQGMVAESWKAPLDWYNTNLMSQVRLHEFLRTARFLKKYVHVTTPEVYGDTKDWISESSSFFPSTPYAVSRAACDMHLLSFFKTYRFPVTFTRAANVYGPGQQLYRIIPRAIIASQTGEKFELHGGGTSRRSFIHIDDVVNATQLIAENGNIGDTYHISTNRLLSILELVQLVAGMQGKSQDDICNTSDERMGKDSAYMLNSSKLRNELNWTDKISLEDGLHRVSGWVTEHFDVISKSTKEYAHKV